MEQFNHVSEYTDFGEFNLVCCFVYHSIVFVFLSPGICVNHFSVTSICAQCEFYDVMNIVECLISHVLLLYGILGGIFIIWTVKCIMIECVSFASFINKQTFLLVTQLMFFWYHVVVLAKIVFSVLCLLRLFCEKKTFYTRLNRKNKLLAI